MKSYTYLRTSGDDGRDKAGLPVQREACTAYAVSAYSIAKTLNAEGIRTRYGCEFKQQTVLNILTRVLELSA
jgi:hypothetical protein